jgi:CheY-like chemotaxis protein
MAKGSVQVIYDEQDQLREIRQALEREFFQVRTATGGETGLASVLGDVPDAVILGNTRGMDGLDLCRRLRADGRTVGLPMLLVTSGGANDRVLALEAGADDSLARPFGLRELVARLKAILRRSSFRPPPDELLRPATCSSTSAATWSFRAARSAHDGGVQHPPVHGTARASAQANGDHQEALGKNTDGLNRASTSTWPRSGANWVMREASRQSEGRLPIAEPSPPSAGM